MPVHSYHRPHVLVASPGFPFSVLSETLQDFLKSNSLLNTELRSLKQNLNWFSSKQTQWLSILSKNKQNKETPGQHSLTPSSRRSTPTRPNFHTYTRSDSSGNVGVHGLGMQQTSVHVELLMPQDRLEQQNLVISFIFVK